MTSSDGLSATPNGRLEPLPSREATLSRSEQAELSSVEEDLAGWTHMWAVAASETYEVINSIWDNESPISAIGRRDAMTMVLVGAARNVQRGSEVLLNSKNDAVQRGVTVHRELKTIRDYLEHFDEYVQGIGRMQGKGGNQSRGTSTLESPGLSLPSSHGGGPEGHVVRLTVTERAADGEYRDVDHEIPTRTIVVSTRLLARDVLKELGLLDERHLRRCPICANPEGI